MWFQILLVGSRRLLGEILARLVKPSEIKHGKSSSKDLPCITLADRNTCFIEVAKLKKSPSTGPQNQLTLINQFTSFDIKKFEKNVQLLRYEQDSDMVRVLQSMEANLEEVQYVIKILSAYSFQIPGINSFALQESNNLFNGTKTLIIPKQWVIVQKQQGRGYFINELNSYCLFNGLRTPLDGEVGIAPHTASGYNNTNQTPEPNSAPHTPGLQQPHYHFLNPKTFFNSINMDKMIISYTSSRLSQQENYEGVIIPHFQGKSIKDLIRKMDLILTIHGSLTNPFFVIKNLKPIKEMEKEKPMLISTISPDKNNFFRTNRNKLNNTECKEYFNTQGKINNNNIQQINNNDETTSVNDKATNVDVTINDLTTIMNLDLNRLINGIMEPFVNTSNPVPPEGWNDNYIISNEIHNGLYKKEKYINTSYQGDQFNKLNSEIMSLTRESVTYDTKQDILMHRKEADRMNMKEICLKENNSEKKIEPVNPENRQELRNLQPQNLNRPKNTTRSKSDVLNQWDYIDNCLPENKQSKDPKCEGVTEVNNKERNQENYLNQRLQNDKSIKQEESKNAAELNNVHKKCVFNSNAVTSKGHCGNMPMHSNTLELSYQMDTPNNQNELYIKNRKYRKKHVEYQIKSNEDNVIEVPLKNKNTEFKKDLSTEGNNEWQNTMPNDLMLENTKPPELFYQTEQNDHQNTKDKPLNRKDDAQRDVLHDDHFFSRTKIDDVPLNSNKLELSSNEQQSLLNLENISSKKQADAEDNQCNSEQGHGLDLKELYFENSNENENKNPDNYLNKIDKRTSKELERQNYSDMLQIPENVRTICDPKSSTKNEVPLSESSVNIKDTKSNYEINKKYSLLKGIEVRCTVKANKLVDKSTKNINSSTLQTETINVCENKDINNDNVHLKINTLQFPPIKKKYNIKKNSTNLILNKGSKQLFLSPENEYIQKACDDSSCSSHLIEKLEKTKTGGPNETKLHAKNYLTKKAVNKLNMFKLIHSKKQKKRKHYSNLATKNILLNDKNSNITGKAKEKPHNHKKISASKIAVQSTSCSGNNAIVLTNKTNDSSQIKNKITQNGNKKIQSSAHELENKSCFTADQRTNCEEPKVSKMLDTLNLEEQNHSLKQNSTGKIDCKEDKVSGEEIAIKDNPAPYSQTLPVALETHQETESSFSNSSQKVGKEQFNNIDTVACALVSSEVESMKDIMHETTDIDSDQTLLHKTIDKNIKTSQTNSKPNIKVEDSIKILENSLSIPQMTCKIDKRNKQIQNCISNKKINSNTKKGKSLKFDMINNKFLTNMLRIKAAKEKSNKELMEDNKRKIIHFSKPNTTVSSKNTIKTHEERELDLSRLFIPPMEKNKIKLSEKTLKTQKAVFKKSGLSKSNSTKDVSIETQASQQVQKVTQKKASSRQESRGSRGRKEIPDKLRHAIKPYPSTIPTPPEPSNFKFNQLSSKNTLSGNKDQSFNHFQENPPGNTAISRNKYKSITQVNTKLKQNHKGTVSLNKTSLNIKNKATMGSPYNSMKRENDIKLKCKNSFQPTQTRRNLRADQSHQKENEQKLHSDKVIRYGDSNPSYMNTQSLFDQQKHLIYFTKRLSIENYSQSRSNSTLKLIEPAVTAFKPKRNEKENNKKRAYLKNSQCISSAQTTENKTVCSLETKTPYNHFKPMTPKRKITFSAPPVENFKGSNPNDIFIPYKHLRTGEEEHLKKIHLLKAYKVNDSTNIDSDKLNKQFEKGLSINSATFLRQKVPSFKLNKNEDIDTWKKAQELEENTYNGKVKKRPVTAPAPNETQSKDDRRNWIDFKMGRTNNLRKHINRFMDIFQSVISN